MVVDEEGEGTQTIRGIVWGLAIAGALWLVIGIAVWLIWCR